MPDEQSVAASAGAPAEESPSQVTVTAGAGRAFAASVRLRNQAQMNYVRANARHFPGRYCVLLAAKPREDGRKVGIVNSRRFSRKAVVRNRARRLLREAYRMLLPLLADQWILLIPRHAIQKRKLPEVLNDLACLCRKAGILEAATGQRP